jgi:alpha-1,2-mannosyltransferase
VADLGIDYRPAVLRPPGVVLVACLVTSLYALAILVTTIPHPGKIGLDHNTLGTDWMVFYGAIRSVLDGHVSLIFDGDRFTDFLNTAFADWLSKPLEFRPWAYPPSFLVLLLPFAPLGFFGSYVAFQAVSAGLMAAALWSRTEGWATFGALLAVTLLCPAAVTNVIDGQAVFLVGALIIGGLRLVPSRPMLGGLVLGLLTFKPQFCILVPLALIAGGQWRALWAAGLSASALALTSGLMFGWELWLRWFPLMFENLVRPDAKWIEYGRMWGNSVYTCAALLGAPPRLASASQLLAMIFAAASVVLAFRSRLSPGERIAVFLAATVLAAPHSGPYDQALLVVAAAYWLMAAGSSALPLWCWTLTFMIWLVPSISPPILFAASRFAPLLTVSLIVLLLRRKPVTAEPALR